jgi:hypothetical protein
MPGSGHRFVRTLDFGVLDGLATRAAAEIRAAEDALIAFTEAQQKRDALHVKTKNEIAAKYNQQDRLGGARDRSGARGAAALCAVYLGRRSRCRCTQGIENQAYHEAQTAAAVYDDVQESLTEVITQARDLCTRIQSGMVPEKDARELLADLGKQRAKQVAKIAPTKSRHDSAHATLKDPPPKGKR